MPLSIKVGEIKFNVLFLDRTNMSKRQAFIIVLLLFILISSMPFVPFPD